MDLLDNAKHIADLLSTFAVPALIVWVGRTIRTYSKEISDLRRIRKHYFGLKGEPKDLNDLPISENGLIGDVEQMKNVGMSTSSRVADIWIALDLSNPQRKAANVRRAIAEAVAPHQESLPDVDLPNGPRELTNTGRMRAYVAPPPETPMPPHPQHGTRLRTPPPYGTRHRDGRLRDEDEDE